MTEARPPLPPFDLAGAQAKVRAAEDVWNTRDPRRVALAYTEDSVWRNRDLFLTGHDEIIRFLTDKWEHELDYVLRKSLWSHDATASPSASSTNGTTPKASGSVPTATSCGSSPTTA